jgi:hypothetical protein
VKLETFVELFGFQVRGTVATAFVYSGVEPTDKQWKMLRGEAEFTMRDIGEIGYDTGYKMHMQLSQSSHLERRDTSTTEGE